MNSVGGDRMNIDKKALGLRIQQIRKEKGLTLEEFGELVLNAGKSAVSKWEKGSSIPNNKRLKVIADLGNMSIESLMFGSLQNYIFEHLYELLPDEYQFIVGSIPMESRFNLIYELENMGATISNLEEIKAFLRARMEQLLKEVEESFDIQIQYIVKNKDLLDEVHKYLEDIHDYDRIKYVFENAERFDLREKIKFSLLIDDITTVLEVEILNLTFFLEGLAFSTTDSYLINHIDNININSKDFLPKQEVLYKVGGRPQFPINEKRYHLLISIENKPQCNLLVKNSDLHVYYFPEMNYKLLPYLFDTQIAVVYENEILVGYFDSLFQFHTYRNNEPLSISIDENFNHRRVLPVASIYY